MRARDSIARAIGLAVVAFGAWPLSISAAPAGQDAAPPTPGASSRAAGLAAWQQVYSVLTHPRCVNCHTATDHPQQGDDRQFGVASLFRTLTMSKSKLRRGQVRRMIVRRSSANSKRAEQRTHEARESLVDVSYCVISDHFDLLPQRQRDGPQPVSPVCTSACCACPYAGLRGR